MGKKVSLVVFLFAAVFLFSLSAISSRYVYNTLSDKDKAFYDRIDEAILSCTERIDATDFTKEDCLRIYSDYLDDHPGIFWCDTKISYTTSLDSSGRVKHGMVFSYTHQDNLDKDKITFVNLVEYFHNYIKDDQNDWFKLFHIYEYLASTIVYDNNYMDQSMWSVFFNGVGVCAGFARSFQYLALLEGIPCLIVTGYERDADGNPGTVRHAWCMAQLDGKWYHFDPTWGVKDSNGNVDYTYFCRSRERIEKTHVIDNEYPLPKAEDDSLSYVSVRRRYLKEYSYDAVEAIAKNAFKRGENLFTLEFPNKTELDKAVSALVTDREILTLLKNLNKSFKSYSYSYNSRGCTLTFSFKK